MACDQAENYQNNDTDDAKAAAAKRQKASAAAAGVAAPVLHIVAHAAGGPFHRAALLLSIVEIVQLDAPTRGFAYRHSVVCQRRLAEEQCYAACTAWTLNRNTTCRVFFL